MVKVIDIEKIEKSQSTVESHLSRTRLAPSVGFSSSAIPIQVEDVTSSDKKVHVSKVNEHRMVVQVEEELPSEEVILLSKKIVSKLAEKNISLDFHNMSHQGGLILEFFHQKNYHMIELFNDGDIVLLKRKKNNLREAFDFDKNSLFKYIKEEI